MAESVPIESVAIEPSAVGPSAIEPFEFAVDELCVRPYRSDDAAALCVAVRESVDSLSRWLDWCDRHYGLADAERWIAVCADGWRSGEQYTFAAFEAATARFVGAVGINQRNRLHHVASIGYWTRESARGRAIAARVARHVARFGFDRLGLARLEILAANDNLASRRTAERIGAQFEGMQRHRLRIGNASVDAAMYSLIPGDP